MLRPLVISLVAMGWMVSNGLGAFQAIESPITGCSHLFKDKTHQLRKFNVLPGYGWDNLANEIRSKTVDHSNFDECRLTPDGKYVLPNDVELVPLLRSNVELSSSMYSYVTDMVSSTSKNINADAGISLNFMKINGDYSQERTTMRRMLKTSLNKMMRAKLEYPRYALYQQPDAKLNAKFLKELENIASLLEVSKPKLTSEKVNEFLMPTMNSLLNRRRKLAAFGGKENSTIKELQASIEEAKRLRNADMSTLLLVSYMADSIVEKYGTHTLTKVVAGASIVKLDVLNTSSMTSTETETEKMEASAGASFLSIVKADISTSTNSQSTNTKDYNSRVTESKINANGGSVFRPSNMTLSDWVDSIQDNLVAINRNGLPIYNLVSMQTMPDRPAEVVENVKAILKAAVYRYYNANAVVGCMKPKSKLFNPHANFNGQCSQSSEERLKEKKLNGTRPFGGMYQTCEGNSELCGPYRLSNLATNAESCPSGFQAVPLMPRQLRECRSVRKEGGWLQADWYEEACVYTRSFWCALDLRAENITTKETGMYFGGAMSDSYVNPYTGSTKCPGNFIKTKLSKDLIICLTPSDDKTDRKDMPRFGGFYSCLYGNPLAFSSLQMGSPARKLLMRWHNETSEFILSSQLWPKMCPAGYENQMISIAEACPITLCLRNQELPQLRSRNLKRPPFIKVEGPYSKIWNELKGSSILSSSSATLSQIESIFLSTIGGIFILCHIFTG